MVVVTHPELKDSYDVIIVGGGTAGLVLANRLSADENRSVLVIEAGEYRPDDPKINTPGLMTTLNDDPTYDWMFRTVPQEHANDRVIGQPRGRLLGGSSALQYGMVVFPSKAGIDAWASLGNPGWDWEGMAPYYRKFHTLVSPTADSVRDLSLDWIDPKTAGSSGPIQASFAGPDSYGPMQKAWPETFKKLNFLMTGDPMSGLIQGAYSNPAAVDANSKTRSYSASAYYAPIADRSNLHVLLNTQADKTILEKSSDGDFVVKGVQWTGNGTQHVIRANKEVLICAGAFQSPQILELSGIGDAKRLEPLGIETLVNNPAVGENLQDHALASISFEVNDGVPTGELAKQPGVLEALLKQYEETRQGPLTYTGICVAYMPLPEYLRVTGNETERRELSKLIEKYSADNGKFPAQKKQYQLLRSIVEDEKDTTAQYTLATCQLNPDKVPSTKGYTSMNEDGNYLTVPLLLSHPFSRGSVHITSKDVKDAPRIDPQYLSNPLDLEIFARHLMFIETIVKTAPLAGFVKEGGRRIPAGAHATDLDKAKDIVRNTLMTTFHPTSTCSMMPQELGGVLNPRLVVHGTKNLRVIDASVFPLMVRGNIQTSVYAVAEKAADLILEDLARE